MVVALLWIDALLETGPSELAKMLWGGELAVVLTDFGDFFRRVFRVWRLV